MKKKSESTKENQTRVSKMPPKPALKQSKGTATNKETDIVALIQKDHIPLKNLIFKLKDEGLERNEKEGLFEQFVPTLMTHAKAEEQSLYVQLKAVKDFRAIGFEGDTEHAIAEQLIHEINATPDDDEWKAKVKVIAELVEAHIQEEEESVLISVEENFGKELRNSIGQMYMAVKSELESLAHPNLKVLKKQAEMRIQH